MNVWTDKSIYEWINKWIKDSEIYDPFIWLSSYLKKKFQFVNEIQAIQFHFQKNKQRISELVNAWVNGKMN